MGPKKTTDITGDANNCGPIRMDNGDTVDFFHGTIHTIGDPPQHIMGILKALLSIVKHLLGFHKPPENWHHYDHHLQVPSPSG